MLPRVYITTCTVAQYSLSLLGITAKRQHSHAERQTAEDNCPQVPILSDNALVRATAVSAGVHASLELQAGCNGRHCKP